MSEDKLTNKQRQVKVQQALVQLTTAARKEAIDILHTLEEIGDETIIEPLYDLWLSGLDQEVENELNEFLSSLKFTACIPVTIELIQQEKYQAILNKLLSTIWNSPLNYSEYIDIFVGLAVKNDFITVVECLTIIENLDGPFEEQDILESQLYLKDYLEGVYPKEAQKDQLISEIALIVKTIDKEAY